MKDLMKTNCYDVGDIIVIVGSCLERMQPKAFNDLKNISSNIYDVCLECHHLNLVITKIIGMICRVRFKKIIFASIDKSPHCVQLHYIENEISGYICPIGDLDAIAEKIMFLHQHGDFLETCGQEARRSVLVKCKKEDYAKALRQWIGDAG